MNERIKELAEQATRKYDRLGNDIPFAHPDLELFAELIIRECVYVLEKNISPLQMKIFVNKHPDLIQMSSSEIQDRNRNGKIEGLLLGTEAIEEHFGVKE